jgi:hypothetical protein
MSSFVIVRCLWLSGTCGGFVSFGASSADVACLISIELHFLFKVNWVQGDATEMKTVEKALKDSDAAVHAIGMLFLPP